MRVPEELLPEWPCHRLVLAEKLTRTEVETLVSIQDVLELNVLYDAWSETQGGEQQPYWRGEQHNMIDRDGSHLQLPKDAL